MYISFYPENPRESIEYAQQVLYCIKETRPPHLKTLELKFHIHNVLQFEQSEFADMFEKPSVDKVCGPLSEFKFKVDGYSITIFLQ